MQSRPEVIDQTIARVLEDWAMMLVEPAEYTPEIFSAENPVYICGSEFRGIVNGRCFLACQDGFRRALVANLTAGEGGDSDLDDVMREALNVLTGNLLTEAYGASHAFDLTPPVLSSLDLPSLSSILEGHIAAYMGDDEPVVLCFLEKDR